MSFRHLAQCHLVGFENGLYFLQSLKQSLCTVSGAVIEIAVGDKLPLASNACPAIRNMPFAYFEVLARLAHPPFFAKKKLQKIILHRLTNVLTELVQNNPDVLIDIGRLDVDCRRPRARRGHRRLLCKRSLHDRSRLVRDVENFSQVVRLNGPDASISQIDRLKPFVQRHVTTTEHGAVGYREDPPTRVAFVRA